MVGRPGWRRSAAFTGGIVLTAAGLFAVASVRTSAQTGGLVERVRSGIRLLSGEDPQARHVTIEGKSPRLLAEEADQRARDLDLLQWGLVDFDPLKGIRFPDGAPAEMAAPSRNLPASLAMSVADDTDYWLIQSDGNAGALRDELEAAGIALLAFVPNQAYLARLDGAQVKLVQGTRGVRWMGRNLPAWKLDADTLGILSGSADPAMLELDTRGLVRIAAYVYKELDEEVFDAYVADMKMQRGVEIIDVELERAETRPRRVLLGVDPAVVRDVVAHLATMRDIQYVLLRPPAHFHNDHAVWYTQSGNDAIQDTDYDVSAPLFRKGLTGRGLIGAVEDDGLENDLCQFRYSSAKNDAAYPVGPRASVPPPDEQALNLDPATVAPIRTRERKVVAYFVMLGAEAYSSPIQHGSGVAGCMAGDNNSVLAARPLIRDVGQGQNVRGRVNGGQWGLGEERRPDLTAKVDTLVNDVGLPGAGVIQHHQGRDGMAPGAQIIFQDIGDLAGNLQVNGDPDPSVLLQASRAGASVHNASFGGINTCPSLNCYLSADNVDDTLWYRRDLTAFVSAGNNGDLGAGSISTGMQHAKTQIVVGWGDRANSASCPPCSTTTPRRGESVNPFSAKGPKSGGLLAPEVIFPGTVVTTVYVDGNGRADPQPNPETGAGTSDGGCGPVSPPEVGGTSFASPVAAGAGLLVNQYFWDGFYPSGAPRDANGRAVEYGGVDGLRPTNALVRAVLVNAARDMAGARTDDLGRLQAHRPNFGQGWGAPRLDDTLYFEGDPKRTAGFDTERARMIVLTDIPNGYDGTGTLAPEPGGKMRDELVKSLPAALQNTSQAHEFQLDVVNDTDGDGTPDPDDPANELRFTLAWSDVVGSTGNAPQVNNLDLEVVSPGPDGVLETSTATGRMGDDVVYRSKPSGTNWVNGYTQASPDQEISVRTGAGAPPPFSGPYGDTDMLNTVENVFIRSQDVVAGTWLVRVVPRSIPAVGGTSQGYPNYVTGDVAPSRDTDGDGTNDLEEYDFIRGSSQGYALLASGNFTTNQGLIALNRANFGCVNERLSLTLNDQNGDSSEPTCTGDLQAVIKTTTPGPAFPSDREVAKFVGTQPVYRSQNQVTGGPDFEVRLVRDPADVIFGDGIIQVAEGETIFAEYVDQFPCGGSAFAQATVSCRPAIGDQGFLIADGCDFAAPGDPSSGARPDTFMDAGELNRYQVFISNDGGTDLRDVVVNLYPDPANDHADLVDVLDSPRYVGYMPPGRIADATFLVRVDAGMSAFPQWQMDMIIEVTSPRDGFLFPVTLRQTQIFEADVVSFRYDTRDPNGELFGKGLIEVLKPGVTPLPGNTNPPSDYVVNEPMWYDPDVPGNTALVCRQPRSAWPNPYVPPLNCDRTSNQNPTDPWDFDDDPNADPDGPGDGWFEAAHDGDSALAGVDFPFMWDWKSAYGVLPGDSAFTGGGCGWEDQLHAQLVASALPASHPDKAIQPFGIWHTGKINQASAGPYAGDVTNVNGVPFYDNPNSRLDRTIMWDPPPTGGADNNATGQWCSTYLSDPNIALDYYRSMLIAPRLYRVHASRPEYRVEFQDLQVYTRLDAHTINGRNLAAAGWFIHNQPVNPSTTTPITYTWDQFQYYTNIFSDRVRPEWTVDDNTLNAELARPSAQFPQYTYEDIFGPAATSWNVALGWIHFHRDLGISAGQYGWGVDDVSFVWTESRDDVDNSDCATLVGGQRPIVWFGENRYNACEGTLRINLWAPDERRDPVAVAVTSAAEDFESALLYFNPATNRYEGEMEFTTDTRNDAVGVLLTSSGSYDTGNGTDTIRVEYDPATTEPCPGCGIDADPATAADVRADWLDADGNGINDDTDNDGVPDAEDDPTGTREVSDVSVINCTSGRLFYVKSELQQVGPGDGDRFADPGETHQMKLYLVSGIGDDLENVEVKISTNDPVCLITDTVAMDLLPGNATVVDTGFGFEFAIPQGMRTTSLDDPRTVTFRIDVRGRNTTNLNEFSTAGESFLTFLPMEAWMLVDVDTDPTVADFVDNAARGGRPVPPTGTWFEGFDGDSLSYGLDHLFGERIQPGFDVNRQLHDSETDTRFGMDGNSGFCPECDVQNDCAVTGPQPACDYYFSTQLTPGYPSTPDLPWNWTEDWVHNGTGAYKFGKNNAPPTTPDQHYPQGVYASMTMPPIRIAATATNPELTFWHIADIWHPNFTGGLSTPIDGAIVEIAPSAAGVGDTGTGDDKVNRSTTSRILQRYPISNFRRLSPYVGLYDDETDALNACRTLFCRYHHPVFSNQGSPIDAPTPPDGREGIPGTPGTWEPVKVDLSDYRGMEVVIQFSAEVLQDLEVQNGSLGWFLDQIQVTGVSNRKGIKLQTAHITDEPCGLTADFAADDPGCFGSEIQFLDRHTGVGTFAPAVPPDPSLPYPIEYEWRIGPTFVLRGLGGDLIPPTPGVFGTYDNPRIDLQLAAGIGSPQSVPVTLNLYQSNGTAVVLADSITRNIVYKDAPVPTSLTISPAFVGGATQFAAIGTFNTTLDPDRTLYWEWDFGDGTAVDTSGPSVQHVYDAPGAYTMTVRVYDEEGCTGTATRVVNVTASPQYGSPAIVPAADPDCGTPFDDGNADIEEVVTVNVNFRNAAGAATGTNIVGYLTSPDPLVEIISGVATFDTNLVAGATSVTRPFRFIRHDDGSPTAPACLVVPFQLTLLSNAGTITQVLDLSFTMGTAANTSFDNAGTQTATFCALPSSDSSTDPNVSYTSAQSGCLNGLRLAVDVSGIGSGTIADLRLTIYSPDSVPHVVLYEGEGPNTLGPYTIDFEFGADNTFGPIANRAGQLVDNAGTLSDLAKSDLVAGLVGTPLVAGATPWRVVASTSKFDTDCRSSYRINVREFQLEGSNSNDLQIGNVITCPSACFPTSAPVFNGAFFDCTQPGRLLFSPASDTSLCDGASDVTYELYASTVAGQLGTRVDGTAKELNPATQSCPANCPTGDCAMQNPLDATFWDVCNTTTVFWTVIAVDGGGARTPNITSPPATTPVPAPYQTTAINCDIEPEPGVIGIVKGNGTLDLWLVPPVLPSGAPSFPTLFPPPNAREYRILRGTIPRTSTMADRDGDGTFGPVVYDHTGYVCAFVTTQRDISADLTTPGSFYYFVPGVNSLGCAGMGQDSEGADIPGAGTGCPSAADCRP